MAWDFDQKPNVACITVASVIAGKPVPIVTHYEDDHSWAFLDGQNCNAEDALVVAISEVIDVHPELTELAKLKPGWPAHRRTKNMPWTKIRDNWDSDQQ